MPESTFTPAPAPWKLKGTGIIIIFKLSSKWVEKFGQLPDYLQGKFKGGLGYLMLVNYEESPVGPYKELLFIPGKFKPNNKQSISKIYVSSEESTQNGRANWGIPKNTLRFSWESKKDREQIKMFDGEKEVFSCQVAAKSISFPVSTRILPIDLHQHWKSQDFYTKPAGNGWGKFAKVKIETCDPKYFPPVDQLKPLMSVRVDPFFIEFPAPSHDL